MQLLAYAGPQQPDLQPGSQESMCQPASISLGHTCLLTNTAHQLRASVRVPLTAPTLQVCPALHPTPASSSSADTVIMFLSHIGQACGVTTQPLKEQS